jgi:hypothetical protein
MATTKTFAIIIITISIIIRGVLFYNDFGKYFENRIELTGPTTNNNKSKNKKK